MLICMHRHTALPYQPCYASVCVVLLECPGLYLVHLRTCTERKSTSIQCTFLYISVIAHTILQTLVHPLIRSHKSYNYRWCDGRRVLHMYMSTHTCIYICVYMYITLTGVHELHGWNALKSRYCCFLLTSSHYMATLDSPNHLVTSN